jgi:Dyp-type peroxidase family
LLELFLATGGITMDHSHTSTELDESLSTLAGGAVAEDLYAAQDGPVGNDIWQQVQRGLVYPAPYALFATFWRPTDGTGQPVTRAGLADVLAAVRHEIHAKLGNANTTAVVGIGFRLWQEWCEHDNLPLPEGMRLTYPAGEPRAPGAHTTSTVFSRSHDTFKDSGGDLWFHIKSDRETDCTTVFEYLSQLLGGQGFVDPHRTVHQSAATKSTLPGGRGGKVLGCRFSENLNNPTNPVSIQKHTIVGPEDPYYTGASFVLAQRFRINWAPILNMGPDQIEDLVGRTTDDIIVPTRDDRSHIKRARVQDGAGDTMRVLRLGLPFGRSTATGNEDLRVKGASARDEEGIYFAGYANTVRALEAVMDSQIGAQDGYMADRLLSNVQSDLGGFYFIPSQTNLVLDPVALPESGDIDWQKFPGIDWSRLDRHFTQRSGNGLMFYNHRDYLYRMTTVPAAEMEAVRPPSRRVLRLLDGTFSLWQDNWYFDRTQQELEHLSVYLRHYLGERQAEDIMALSVVERMGWTVKIGLGKVFPSHEYGFRGRVPEHDGNWRNGADTYHIDPAELIVGGMPNIGLGQGKYVIDYTRDDEQLANFFQGLSAASGGGHVVPGYQRLLTLGIDGLIEQVSTKLAATEDVATQQFYRAVVLALEGVSDHCMAFAGLATELVKDTAESQRAEVRNLLAIQARMRKLAHHKPDSLIEAAQLVFTLHSCLHLIGEPTAIGRLDQLLQPFYENDRDLGIVTDDQAQEIIDCFWVKLGEKVQPNRMFVEDHQPFGNMALGGFSANYPQGAANNQWVQQITVGGTVADDATGRGTPAYNDVTMFCLRAARRLPLNAPCLSLRVRPDMPAEYVHEAALALLSGGAHPILLNDEKVIKGLVHSGEHIGDGTVPTASTPVREKAGERWRSEVPLRVARDYACDGCYEPQFTGQNWFTIGGLNTVQVLEATLNQGKSWLTAGPMWFRGQKISFTSVNPKDLREFDDVVELFCRHLSWMYAKQVDDTLAGFGRVSTVCPSPLLSCFVDDCIEKGLDQYAGGPRYTVFGPGFTGLPNVINSLYAVRQLVFDETTAVTSLPELVQALICDWGESMTEPFVSTLAGEGRIAARAERFRDLRAAALTLPRYGRGHKDIDAFGNEILRRVCETAVDVFTKPAEPTARRMVELAKQLGTPEHPFGMQVQPGVGTFENHVEFGAMCGASADGRRAGQPMASDLSPSPSPADLPVDHQEAGFLAALRGYIGEGTDALWNTAPTDVNIREDFPVAELEKIIKAFGSGVGSNLLTITCADPATFEQACQDPEKYDLVRVRVGGWSEYFVAMFPAHQQQHRRRPLSLPDDTAGTLE